LCELGDRSSLVCGQHPAHRILDHGSIIPTNDRCRWGWSGLQTSYVEQSCSITVDETGHMSVEPGHQLMGLNHLSVFGGNNSDLYAEGPTHGISPARGHHQRPQDAPKQLEVG